MKKYVNPLTVKHECENQWKILEKHSGGKGLFQCSCGRKLVREIYTVKSGKSKRCKACYDKARTNKLQKIVKKRLQKKCSVCYRILSIEKFWCNKNSLDGHFHRCIKCSKKDDKSSISRKWRERRKIKKLIKYEVTYSLTKFNKMLWNGIGKWSRKYKDIYKCTKCETNIYKHHSREVCMKCYYSERHKSASKKEYTNKEKMIINKRNKEHLSIENLIFNNVLKGDIEITPTIKNLLNNLK